MAWIKGNKILLTTGIALLFTLLYKFVFINKEEIFKGASILGDLTYNLSLATLGSSIFYYLVVYLKEKESKNKVARVINLRLGHLQMMRDIIYRDILTQTRFQNPPNQFPADQATFINICRDIKLSERPAPYWNGDFHQFETWFDYFDYTFQLDKYNINIIFNYAQFINEETLERFHEVTHTTFHSGIRQYRRSTEEYADRLESLGGPMWNYLNILSQFTENSWR